MCPHRLSLYAILALCASAPAFAQKTPTIIQKVLVQPTNPLKAGDVTVTQASDGSAQLTQAQVVTSLRCDPKWTENAYLQGLNDSAALLKTRLKRFEENRVDVYTDIQTRAFCGDAISETCGISGSILDIYQQLRQSARAMIEYTRVQCNTNKQDPGFAYAGLLSALRHYDSAVMDLIAQAAAFEDRDNESQRLAFHGFVDEIYATALKYNYFRLPANVPLPSRAFAAGFQKYEMLSSVTGFVNSVYKVDVKDMVQSDRVAATGVPEIDDLMDLTATKFWTARRTYGYRVDALTEYIEDGVDATMDAAKGAKDTYNALGLTVTDRKVPTSCSFDPVESTRSLTPDETTRLQTFISAHFYGAIAEALAFDAVGRAGIAATTGCDTSQPLGRKFVLQDAIDSVNVAELPLPCEVSKLCDAGGGGDWTVQANTLTSCLMPTTLAGWTPAPQETASSSCGYGNQGQVSGSSWGSGIYQCKRLNGNWGWYRI